VLVYPDLTNDIGRSRSDWFRWWANSVYKVRSAQYYFFYSSLEPESPRENSGETFDRWKEKWEGNFGPMRNSG